MSTRQLVLLPSLLAAASAAAQPIPPTSIALVDRARAAGLGDVAAHGSSWFGGGVVFADLDGDGWPDLYFGGGAGEPDTYCENQRDGTFACAPAGQDNPGDVLAISGGDYDGDGDLDLFVMRRGPCSLFRNDGGGRFTDVTAETHTAGLPNTMTPTGTFFDFDGDGRLDLYLGHWTRSLTLPSAHDEILRQQEDGTFVDAIFGSGVDDKNRSTLAMAAIDYDEDGRQDLYVTGDFAPSLLFHNDGGGHFSDVTGMQGAGFASSITEGMGIDAADFDRNGTLDFYVTGNHTGPMEQGSMLLVNDGHGTFTPMGVQYGVNAGYSWGTGFVDFDSDGWPDLFVATNVADHYSIYRNESGQRFVEQRLTGLESGNVQCLTAAFADYDNDGRVDVILHQIDGHRPQLLHNETESGSHFLQVVLRTPKDELGTRVRVRTDDGVQERQLLSQTSKGSQSERRFTFGIGQAAQADVEVRFPDGWSYEVPALAADSLVSLDRNGVVGNRIAPPRVPGCSIVADGGEGSAAPWAALAVALLALALRSRRRSV